MSAATLPPLTSDEVLPRKRFTRAEVERMIDAGLFAGQRFELIEGDLIEKMGQKPLHAFAISALVTIFARIFGMELLRVQLPIEVAVSDQEYTLPEPDIAVLAELKADYVSRHPRGDEVLLVVEVADSTVRYDSTRKRDLYARANVREYWVVDLSDRQLRVHRRPANGQYDSVVRLSLEDIVAIECRATLQLRVVDLFPSLNNLT